MKVSRQLALEGPNVWMKKPALEVCLEQSFMTPDALVEGVRRIAVAWDRAAPKLRPSDVSPLAWPDAPRDAAEIIVALTLNLQRRAEFPVRHGFVIRTEQPACLVIEINEDMFGRYCFEIACKILEDVCRGETLDLSASVTAVVEHANRVCLGFTTGPIVNAAVARGIPVLRLDEESLVQLGHGAHQRRIQTAITDRSGYIAEAVSRDKLLTKKLLQRLGIPVPDGRNVRDADEAWKAACEMGLPVVVKPRDADYGNGVSLNLMTQADIARAVETARPHGTGVVVERFLEGAHHRLMVVGNEVVAATRFDRASIVGDGERTVAELIAELNRDPRRGAKDDVHCPWFLIELNDETCRVLALQNHSRDSVPLAGERVVLRYEPRIGWGGGISDVTDDVHPDVAATVVDAVMMVGLDVAGVDLIATDISRPLAEQNGGILEVNAGPSIGLHLSPRCQPSRPVPESIVALMFPQPESARIPVVALHGNETARTVSRWLSELLSRSGRVVGRSGYDGVFVDQRCLRHKPSDNLAGTRTVLMHPRVDVAVCEISGCSLRFEGLAFDRTEIAALLNAPRGPSVDVSPLRLLLETTQGNGVAILNVDDPELARLVPDCGSHVVAISIDAANPTIGEVLHRGGRAVFFRDHGIVLAAGTHETALLPLRRDDRADVRGRAGAVALLAVVACGWTLDIAPELLRRELSRASGMDSFPTAVGPELESSKQLASTESRLHAPA